MCTFLAPLLGWSTRLEHKARRPMPEEALYPDGLEPYKRVRLAAATIGRTPTPILVPCHRVIGADGSLTGYGGGLERKQALLDLESGGAAGRVTEPDRSTRQISML